MGDLTFSRRWIFRSSSSGLWRSEDGGRTDRWNVGFLHHYTASQPRRPQPDVECVSTKKNLYRTESLNKRT